jgi:5-methyltetrahydropteroyltriglutamate--homocysteine methyltransferase
VDSLLAVGIEPARISLNPDCGFAPGMGARVDPDEVYAKLKNQCEAARQLRERYATASPTAV